MVKNVANTLLADVKVSVVFAKLPISYLDEAMKGLSFSQFYKFCRVGWLLLIVIFKSKSTHLSNLYHIFAL